MATGNNIIVSAEPRGVFHEGIISGSGLLPGTHVQLKAATDHEAGRPTWEVWNRNSARDAGLVAILLPDYLQGKTESDTFSDGDRCQVYCPIPGEELNVRTASSGTGTTTIVSNGDYLTINDGTGWVTAVTGTNDADPEQYQAMEDVTDSTDSSVLVHCIFTGY